MKKSKRSTEKRVPPVAAAWRLRWWHYAAGVFAALVAALLVYQPAIRGQFVFDDLYLPFTGQEFENAPLWGWIAGVRPLLMFSFWANFHLSEYDPFSYHLTNVLLHWLTSGLVFLCARRILERAGVEGFRRDILSGFVGGLFLLYPLQTESVAYVASRSEVLSVALFYLAFAVFLYRSRDGVSWLAAIPIIIVYALAASTKEHAAVLPALFLLTDYYWGEPGLSLRGVRKNWRVYALIAAGAVFAGRWVFNVLRTSDTAGFALKEFTWYQYLFTQFRAIWLYIRLFFIPYGQNVDHDVPISRNLLDHGALVGLLALAALAGAAIWYRRRYPLASYGMLMFQLLLAPTSSFLPILDPVAERRMYLPMMGLLLALCELLRRWKASRAVLAAGLGVLLLAAGVLTYNRSGVWSTALALWQDSVEKSPQKYRPRFQLALATYELGPDHCGAALEHYELAAKFSRAPDYRLLTDWALALDCQKRWDEAVGKLEQARILMDNAHVHALIGLTYEHMGRREEALAEFETAIKLDPAFEPTYTYRGALYASSGDLTAALADYQRAMSLNPSDPQARNGLAIVQRAMANRR